MCITHIPTLDYEILEKEKFSYVICTDFLEFNTNLTFVQLFIGSYLLKIRIYIVYIMSWNTKFAQYFKQTHGYKNAKSL